MSVLEVSPNVRSIQALHYRPIALRAAQIRNELKQGTKKPFKEVVDVAWGDSQKSGVKPLTFTRQVVAACMYPQLLDSNRLPADVKQKVHGLLSGCLGGSMGSYTDLPGIPLVAQQISEYIAKRDGVVPPKIENIFISAGSQWALQSILSLLVHVDGEVRSGVLMPAPGHVAATMSLTGLGGVAVPYYLSEEHGWELQVEELSRALESAKQVCNPVAIYVVNPGNPAGYVQNKKSIQDVIRFASENRLFLLADEVYQDCIYADDVEFVSYRKALAELGPPFSDTVELASFHSASKGFLGECGLRGGYVELVNLDKAVLNHACIIFVKDNAPTPGQVALGVLTNPPQPGDPSYPLYEMETQQMHAMIKTNVRRIHEVMNSLPGMSCQPVEGGAFAFARIHLPPKAIQKAKELGMEPDAFYCLRLLEDAGVLTTPGCDFGQKEGTYHIRFCVRTSKDIQEHFLSCIVPFHKRFMEEFS